ncbi:MAG: BTAD domain-containing putative transcriptional regulator [Thermotogota bacterium]|nr:BTAD domain-containing putative transcriptional regulator [Thermotogota bacterium]
MIKVTTLGNYSVYSEKLGLDILGSYCKSEKGCELFKYLLVNYGQKIKKEHILELFWLGMDEKNARQNLSSTLYIIRRAFDRVLGRSSGKKICRSTNHPCWLTFDKNFWYDVVQFRKEIDMANKTSNLDEKIDHLVKASIIYAGDFMIEDTDNEWIIPIREELREIAIASLVELIELLYKDNKLNESMYYTIRLLQIVPHNENGINNKIRILESQGRLAEAKRTFSKYSKFLEKKMYDKSFQKMNKAINDEMEKNKEDINIKNDLYHNKISTSQDNRKGALFMDFKIFMKLSKFESLQREPRGAILSFNIEGFEKLNEEKKTKLIQALGSTLRRGDVISYQHDKVYILLIKSGNAFTRNVQKRVIEQESFTNLVKNFGMNLMSEVYNLKDYKDYLLFESLT